MHAHARTHRPIYAVNESPSSWLAYVTTKTIYEPTSSLVLVNDVHTVNNVHSAYNMNYLL